jgi:uncharacterized membrane protein
MDSHLRAKTPISPVAGPYGHPLHPLLVTVPIGTWLASLVFDIASHAVGDGGFLVYGSYWLVGIGCVGAIAAALFGLLDLSRVARGTRAFRVGITHAALNVLVLTVFGVSFFLRGEALGARGTPPPFIALSVVALGLLAASGWLGGKLAYSYGVRVADEKRQAEGFLPPGHLSPREV